MGVYDKTEHSFSERSKETVGPFPDLNREALGYVLDVIHKKYGIEYRMLDDKLQENKRKLKKLDGQRRAGQVVDDIEVSLLQGSINDCAIQREKLILGDNIYSEDEKQTFFNNLQNDNFSKLYAWAIDKVTPASQEELSATNGEWVKYDQDSDHMPLVRSLEGHGTGWCTAGESTAQAQLQGGDFYVYYSMDKSGKPTVPRIAIRMQQDSIAEVRGIAPNQNLDTGVAQIVEDKLKEFPDGELYKKRVADMKFLTEIENKVKDSGSLTAQDLRFFYEIDSSIEGFGYERDPRIKELRDGRNPDRDMFVIFDCEPSEIAHSAKHINEHTKAYVGKLEPGIFNRVRKYGIEHVYTKFPEGRVRIQDLEIGGKDFNQLERELSESGMNVSGWAESMIRNRDFTTLSEPQNLSTVRLKVSDLGFTSSPTQDQIYQKAKDLGLELCPAEAGLHLRLKYKDQPMKEWLYMGMKPITGSNDRPYVFELYRFGGSPWLDVNWANPDSTSDLKNWFVFSLRANH
jgi:hypothetical protein